MAINFPRNDILTTVGFEPPFVFEAPPRQELSRLADGTTVGKDYGSAKWFATYKTEELLNDAGLDFAAVLRSLNGVLGTFEAWDLRRPTPLLYKDGSAHDGALHSVNANNKALSLSGLNASQVVSRGDYLSFTYGTNRALHSAMETTTANGAGLTPEFEVYPHLRPGWTLAQAINLKAPRGIFTLIPGSFVPTQTRGTCGVVTFQAEQYLE